MSRAYISIGCFIAQALITSAFCGLPAVMFSAIIPDALQLSLLLPFLVLGYFSLGAISLYYLQTPEPKKGRLFGYAYFSLGLVGSIVVVAKVKYPETPLLPIVFTTWALISLIGVMSLRSTERIPKIIAVLAITFLMIPAFICALTTQWVAVE
ncbi:hypothetical protein P8X24_03345 [Pyrococcus kukulkanii]|uniref:hypothetical protein n=1 Tax=Pyrococcus kukulkanii TaxID=1609559 RepID=UPI003567FB19